MIQLRDLGLRRGRQQLFSEVDVNIHRGQKIGITGRNGSGKSSLFALLLGELSADTGAVSIPPHMRIASVAQETPALPRAAIEFVLDGDEELRAIEAALSPAEADTDGHRLAELHAEFETIDGYSARARASTLLHGLGFAPADLPRPVHEFSGGWRMRLNLARALMCRSDLLLLDEPTNHLDLDTVLWLEGWLRRYAGTLLLISHDRDFLDAVVDHIAHVSADGIKMYHGGYSDYERQYAEHLAHQHAMQSRQQREVQHMRAFVNRFRAKATKARQAQSRLKALERMEVISIAHVDSPFNFSFRPAEKLPLPLLSLDQVSAGYADRVVLSALKMHITPGDRIGLLGPNGAGKSTLIRLLAGELSPLSGQRLPARDLKIGYFAQHQLEQLDLTASPLLLLQRLDREAREQEILDFLGGFGFRGEQAGSACRHFSGGEKARLVLAQLVWQRPNLLLLDEPTNHLDLEMRHSLTLALQEFDGALLIVSHDRHLLRTNTDSLLLVAHGKVSTYDGDLEDYRKTLSGQQAVAVVAETDNPAHSASARRERRREEAELRLHRQPQIKRLQRLEQSLEQYQAQLRQLEQQLADTTIYSDENKLRLQQTLQQQTQLKQTLEQTESEWLELGEALEG